MRNFKMLFIIYQVVSTIMYFPLPANSACSVRTLKNVCDVCADRAVSKLNTNALSTDSVSPNSQQVNCPSVSQACIQHDSFHAFLRQSYTLSAMVWEDQPDVLFRLNITRNENFPDTFTYDVRYKDFTLGVKDSTGYIIYDIVNFNLPFQVDDKFYSLNCIGGIDNTSVITGVCSTIDLDETNVTNVYRFPFTALPNTNPLQ